MNRYLVVSYDEDEQQWFYDIVLAETADAACEWVCKQREYVIGADALTTQEIVSMGARMVSRSDEEVRAHMDELVAARAEAEL